MKTPVVALVNKQNSYEVNVSTVIDRIYCFISYHNETYNTLNEIF